MSALAPISIFSKYSDFGTAAFGVYPWTVVRSAKCVRVAQRSLVSRCVHSTYSPSHGFEFVLCSDTSCGQRPLGVTFNETHRFRSRIAEEVLTILGDNLLSLQVGDQPDQYVIAGMRPYVCCLQLFGTLPLLITTERGIMARRVHGQIWLNHRRHDQSHGPTGGLWTAQAKSISSPGRAACSWAHRRQRVLDTGDGLVGWVPRTIQGQPRGIRSRPVTMHLFSPPPLTAIDMHLPVTSYSSNNCFGQPGTGTPIDAQTILPSYLNHSVTVELVRLYRASARVVQTIGSDSNHEEPEKRTMYDEFRLFTWSIGPNKFAHATAAHHPAPRGRC